MAMVLREAYGGPQAPYEGGGIREVPDVVDDGGGDGNPRQGARLARMMNSRSRALRNRMPNVPGISSTNHTWFGPGGGDFLLAANRSPGSPTDFLPPSTGGYGFQRAGNAAGLTGYVGQAPTPLPGPLINGNPNYPVAPTSSMFTGKGSGFLLSANRPNVLKTGGNAAPTKV